uniref:ORF2 n=1 Tax=Torque teno virus TaxID=68887 RepID=Q2F822_9VIRU|nr:ORF2 [Torque teno virus]ABD34293.1 ORF2 [Torque teno virus]
MGKALRVFILNMFLGRVYRHKKRKVLLSTLRAPQASRRAMSWRPPVHDAPGIERNWYEACFRAHAGACGCGNFIMHLNLLAGRYGFTPGSAPPGGPPPGTPQIRRARPSPAAPQEPAALPWHGDGGDGGAAGPPDAGGDAVAGAPYGEQELADLLDAIEDDEQ